MNFTRTDKGELKVEMDGNESALLALGAGAAALVLCGFAYNRGTRTGIEKGYGIGIVESVYYADKAMPETNAPKRIYEIAKAYHNSGTKVSLEEMAKAIRERILT